MKENHESKMTDSSQAKKSPFFPTQPQMIYTPKGMMYRNIQECVDLYEAMFWAEQFKKVACEVPYVGL